MINTDKLVRPNILKLKPYSSARNEFTGMASVYLDANENPLNSPYNRYPDPLQKKLKEKISVIKKVSASQIMLGVGSDEPIDLIIRIFCEPKEDNIVAIDPSYGMYEVCANINNVEYRKIQLNEDFTLDAQRLLDAVDDKTKVIYLCSPNNPTGNALDSNEILKILNSFGGIVVIDEAYIDFSTKGSWLDRLDEFDNLIIMQTFSKAWGLASVRCGMAFASEEIISFFNKVKYPYNINFLTQELVLKEIEFVKRKEEWVEMILQQREWMVNRLNSIPFVRNIYPSDANFLLVKVEDADIIYNKLVAKGVIVRSRNRISLCKNCLRITIGTEDENTILINELKQL
jgi:histidinol-phosphate aminotransferase